ncbi:MAG: FAD-dependent oxidoreductase [Acidimicrobiia bacterium]|nr:FAD-dependent oxidoreductase [Acidimicrobiia bacterium]NNF10931.1 FAD-dependent oxidoreductase [Acidimicrobiia bacterium]NNL69391.1 FAD-dependent oxidoreductase [Acidimicrobiia bacterium]
MSLPSLGRFDVVVVGSGSAGSSAAIAAARTGAAVLLVEKLPFLGGVSTAVLDTFYGFYTPGSQAEKVVGGIGDDVVAGLRRLGPVLERPNTYGAGTGITYLAEHLKVVWEDLVTGSGVTVLLHAFVQEARVTDGRIESLVIATKAGLHTVESSVFVDASGDGDVCHFAGFGYELAGDLAPAQTLTTTFRMVNVDHAARSTIGKDRLHELMASAAESGEYDLPRREGSDHITPVDGMIATVMTRVDQVERDAAGVVRNATDPAVLTAAEMAGRRQALEYVRFLIDKVPGYEHARLVALSTQIGLRETRRVYGDYRLTREDVLAARHFDDQIGLCGAPIEAHDPGLGTTWEYLPDGAAVGIPLRTLVPRDGVNALMAGRCFSAEHDAQASVRSMAQCMAMGQAAGTAAALAADHGGQVRAVERSRLLDQLDKDGAVLAMESA